MTCAGFSDPLAQALHDAVASGGDLLSAREAATRQFGFAVPCDAAFEAIDQVSPEGVVEIGAGTGYWAHAAGHHGIDVMAFDIDPAPSLRNPWFAGSSPWHPVQRGDHRRVVEFPERSLLIVWPTRNEMWPVETLDLYADAGGTCVIYVGEGPGGRSGDDAFHARLGETGSCLRCAHGISTVACTCAFPARWDRAFTVNIPQWSGFHDQLCVYRRRPPTHRRRWHRWSARRTPSAS